MTATFAVSPATRLDAQSLRSVAFTQVGSASRVDHIG